MFFLPLEPGHDEVVARIAMRAAIRSGASLARPSGLHWWFRELRLLARRKSGCFGVRGGRSLGGGLIEDLDIVSEGSTKSSLHLAVLSAAWTTDSGIRQRCN